ncbi:Endonuclease V [bacterium HR40]|nr:Endonuclease V [bacterium HR40]
MPLSDPTWPARFAGQDWPKTPKAARELQEALRAHIVLRDQLGPVTTVCGIDVHYEPRRGLAWAAAALLLLQDLDLELSVLAAVPSDFPYVPGLLSFREAPAALKALALLAPIPDLLVVDGHGYAHPRRFGIACHIGLLTGLPTIGVAKSRLVGEHREPGPEPGDHVPLVDHGEVVGAVLRTRRGARPVYVSVGHRLSLPRAIALTLSCCRGFRLPEPVRLADRLSRCHPD